MLKKAAKKGFTLVEMLVVICIILLLMSLIVVLIKGSMDRAKNAKSKALIELLNQACQAYYTDFGQYPAMAPYSKSQNLHFYLGSPRVVVMQYATTGPNLTTLKPPYVEFKKDMLAQTATNTTPNPPSLLYDAWERVVEYQNPGVNNAKMVDIWSPGKDAIDPLDDITNWVRDF